MGFYEDIAAALDSEGVESRIHDDVLFVPIAPELEIQFRQVETSGRLSSVTAAQVFVATPESFGGGDGDSEGGTLVDGALPEGEADEALFDTALVGVVFSAQAAVTEVFKHIATDEVVSVINDLLDGTDDRVADLDFSQDDTDPLLLMCPVALSSDLSVRLSVVDGEPRAEVQFIAQSDAQGSAEEFAEVLELGTFTDFNELFNALAVATANAEEWEELLTPVGEPLGRMDL